MFVRVKLRNVISYSRAGEFVFQMRVCSANTICLGGDAYVSYQGNAEKCLAIANAAMEFYDVEIEIKKGRDYNDKEAVQQKRRGTPPHCVASEQVE